VAIDIGYWLQPPLDNLHTYGLFFLLGSFTVASLSDIRRMSAQSEFLHVWVLALIALFIVDVYSLRTEPIDRFAAKWALTGVLGLLSYRRVGIMFRLEWGDVAALLAVCGLLSPLIVLLFFVILKVVDLFLRPLLLHAGHGGAYPFMPVATVATLAAIPIATFLQAQVLVL
jgi:hypothetical protein